MLKIRGVNVFPSQVESALINIKHISPHYQLVVRRKGYADTLEVRVELIDGSLLEKYAELEALQKNIHEDVYKRQLFPTPPCPPMACGILPSIWTTRTAPRSTRWNSNPAAMPTTMI